MKLTSARSPLILITFGLTACALACGGEPAREVKKAPPGVETFTVMTYNVNYGLAGDEETTAVLASASADLIFLQETTAAWKRVLEQELSERYPHQHFVSAPGAGGQAVLSKRPFRVADVLPARHGWFPALRVIAKTPVGEVQVLSVHLRPPISDGGSVVSGYFSTPRVRRAEIGDFWSQVDQDLPTLVVGDFNEEEDGRAIEFLARQGLKSALPEFSPGADTWRWRTSVGSVHSRLDHIVYNPKLVPLSATVLERGRSDHLPVLATFHLAEAHLQGGR